MTFTFIAAAATMTKVIFPNENNMFRCLGESFVVVSFFFMLIISHRADLKRFNILILDCWCFSTLINS